METDDEQPLAEELRPAGGTWAGLLFENPLVGLVPFLSWSFNFDFEAVARPEGGTQPGATLEWVPLPRCDWRAMSGLGAASTAFGEPFEASVYFFMHHRYEQAAVEIVEQDKDRLLVRAVLRGDLDCLGIPVVRCQSWLRFDGIRVSLNDVECSADALTRLAGYTAVDGLVEAAGRGAMRFAPSAAGRD